MNFSKKVAFRQEGGQTERYNKMLIYYILIYTGTLFMKWVKNQQEFITNRILRNLVMLNDVIKFCISI